MIDLSDLRAMSDEQLDAAWDACNDAGHRADAAGDSDAMSSIVLELSVIEDEMEARRVATDMATVYFTDDDCPSDEARYARKDRGY